MESKDASQNIITFTGEQMIPGQTRKKSSEEEHMARYTFTKSFVQNKTVLDVACGVGYGSAMIKSFGATSVYGVDISSRAIQYAQTNYGSDGVTFICETATHLPFADQFFDVIISFETIEHLDEESRKSYLHELFRVLKREGILILSTPNRSITSPYSKTPLNPHHVIEYNEQELARVMSEYGFEITDWYGQRVRRKILSQIFVRKFVSLIERLKGSRFNIYDLAQGADVIPFGKSFEPRYFVILAHPIAQPLSDHV